MRLFLYYSFSKIEVFASGSSSQSSPEKKVRMLLRAFGPISFQREREKATVSYVSPRILSAESFVLWLRQKITTQTSIYLTDFTFTSVDKSSGFSTGPSMPS
jgi:hypothetical protein